MSIVDDCMATCGTINLDYRSLYHHFECAAYLREVRCLPDIEKDFHKTLLKCRTVSEETVKKEKPLVKVTGVLAKIIAPLL